MSSIGTGYDLSASQFSPDGRVFQIEYANKAVENSGTAVGIRGKDGVVFAVEKIVTSKLYEKVILFTLKEMLIIIKLCRERTDALRTLIPMLEWQQLGW